MNAQQLGALALVYLGVSIIFNSIASISSSVNFVAPMWASDSFMASRLALPSDLLETPGEATE